MPEYIDCPSCNDLPGTPVPGQEDVYAFAMPMPPDDQLNPWHAMQPSAKPVRTPNSVAQSPWPEGLFDVDTAPEPGPIAAANTRVEYLPPLNAPSHQLRIEQHVQQPTSRLGNSRDQHDANVSYLRTLGAPWLSSNGGGNNDEQGTDEPLPIPPDNEQGESDELTSGIKSAGPYAGAPTDLDVPSSSYREDAHQEVKLRPKKADGPSVKLPDADDAEDFNEDWKSSRAWLPEGRVLLSCPTEVTHKVVIYWVDSGKVGTVATEKEAERLAEGAMESNPAEEALADSLNDDLPKQQVDKFLDKRGWTCEAPCKRETDIVGYSYIVQVKTVISRAGQGDDDVYIVELYILHHLFAWVRIQCVR
jgi:hypothetical protein